METKNDLKFELFFTQFKEFPQYYNLDAVSRLLIQSDFSASSHVKMRNKPLIYIITTSVVIFSLGLILTLFHFDNIKPTVAEYESNSIKGEDFNLDNAATIDTYQDSEANNQVKSELPIKLVNTFQSYGSSVESYNNNNPYGVSETFNQGCLWPVDTVIDKEIMFVRLSNAELKLLGIYCYDSALIYNNEPLTRQKGYAYNLNQNFAPELPPISHHLFTAVYTSDKACTKYRWGHHFYKTIDTLMPIIVPLPTTDTLVFWFTVNDELFSILPLKYRYLGKVYANLKCIKLQNANYQNVNYLNIHNNIVLDSINYLNLSLDELRNLGIGISDRGILIEDPNSELLYKNYTNAGTYTTHGPFPPNPLPLIVTDEKGLELHFFGDKNIISNQAINFNTLVPVKIPMNEIFGGEDYYDIFWFYPTNDFLNKLPAMDQDLIRREYNDINENTDSTKTSSCQFFESCKSTLGLKNFTIFPNPTRGNLSVVFSVENSTTGTIYLCDITGVIRKVLVDGQLITAGNNQINLSLDGMPVGLYILKIEVNGLFQTQRIIVSK